MNILISTTYNWNPGDSFIRCGVKKLLKNNIDEDINWIHYDRNPDYFIPGTTIMGSNHKSNIMNDPIDWELIDLVVLAGSPEFLHGPLKPLYDGLVNHPEILLLAIGVGYSFSVDNINLTKNELNVLKRDNSIIITRQYDLQNKLKELLNKEVYCLPCPAIFALDKKQHSSFKTLLIPQTTIGPQAISHSDNEKIKEYINDKTDILCHYIEDFKEFGGYFSSDYRDLLNKISQYDNIITCRLHGGLVALGNRSSVEFVNSSNRVQKALEPFEQYKMGEKYFITSRELFEIKQKYDIIIKRFIENAL